MNSYKYEVICKNALIKELKRLYDQDFTIEELHLVWFAKALQNYKCVIVDLEDNQRYYELTFNGTRNQIYLDIYEKQYNVVINDFNDTVKE